MAAVGPPTSSLTFIGTATSLIRLGSFTLLTDPNFLHRGQRAYLGKGLWSRRLTEPAMQPSVLPELDLVLLSHLHGDHFDRIARRRLAKDQPVFTTAQAAGRLKRWGFDAHELPTWERTELVKGKESLSIEAMPAIHARGLMGALLPPVTGFMVEHLVAGECHHRIYISGDTLTGAHLQEIARRYPRIDTAIMHLGGTRVLWHTVTMDADQGVDMLHRLVPTSAIPVHYDDYRAFRSPLSAFLAESARVGVPCDIRPVARGETVSLTRPAA